MLISPTMAAVIAIQVGMARRDCKPVLERYGFAKDAEDSCDAYDSWVNSDYWVQLSNDGRWEIFPVAEQAEKYPEALAGGQGWLEMVVAFDGLEVV